MPIRSLLLLLATGLLFSGTAEATTSTLFDGASTATILTEFDDDEGKLALVNGVGLVNSSMSHFDAQDVGSNDEDAGWGLGRGLRQVASILSWDDANPGDTTGLCVFHLGRGGFDTHSRQGTTDASNGGHPRLWDELSVALYNFQRDLEVLGVSDRVVTLL